MNNDINDSDEYVDWEAAEVASQYLFKESASLSDSDNFVNIWIAFNAWMKAKFGTYRNDSELIKIAVNHKPLMQIFEYLKRSDEKFEISLLSLIKYEITNKKTSKTIRYNGTFKSLINTIYVIRGNIFHGTELTGKNNKLHKIVFDILYRLLNKTMFPYVRDAGPSRL